MENSATMLALVIQKEMQATHWDSRQDRLLLPASSSSTKLMKGSARMKIVGKRPVYFVVLAREIAQYSIESCSLLGDPHQ
jgi:hypothetical protein